MNNQSEPLYLRPQMQIKGGKKRMLFSFSNIPSIGSINTKNLAPNPYSNILSLISYQKQPKKYF
jgi:hypothetical protein